MEPINKERKIVEASARLLTSRYHTGLPFEKARGIIEGNRRLAKPALYAGANYDMADFLATGCETGVFLDPQYVCRAPNPRSNIETYAEDFLDDLKQTKEEVSGFSIRGEGDMRREGRWIIGFSFCGEQKTVVCYGKTVWRLAHGSLNPRELEGGIAHYSTVHYPTEWSTHFLDPSLLDRIVQGGHLETWFPDGFEPLFRRLDLKAVHSEMTRQRLEKIFGSMTIDGTSIYDDLVQFAIFRKGGMQGTG